ncbi:MAG: class I SAM-dependent methyltransferase [Candidatus Aminicenantes bacterium]|nr:class I SAM-dependent methyltransferase [Candidatus Aminicenantes bacterium]
MEEQYDPKTYWEERLSKRLDISSVGQLGLGCYNHWLYKARFRAMHRAIEKLRIDLSGKSLVAVGVGSGAWIPFWENCGVSKIVGYDITSVSVLALRKKYPQFQFFEGDIGSELFDFRNETFDIVTAFDLLFHITDDRSFHNAIFNLSKLGNSDAWVLITDSFGSDAYGPFHHEYHRTYKHYLNGLKQARLQAIHLEPIFFAMTTALCASDIKLGKFLSKFIGVMLRIVAIIGSIRYFGKINHLVGYFLYVLDGVFYRVMRKGSSLKILFTSTR